MTTPSTQAPDILQSSSVTNIDADIYSHTWRISNFISYKSHTEINLESTKFRIGKGDTTCWLRLVTTREGNLPTIGGSPVGEQQLQSDACLTFYLHIRSSSPEETFLRIDVSMILENNERLPLKSIPKFSYTLNAQMKVCSYTKKGIFDSSKYLPNGDLVLVFELMMFCESSSHNIADKSVYATLGSTMLMHELGNLFDSGSFTDFTIKCTDKEFKVHKAILAARSPVFAAMFNSSMTEAKENCVSIVDVDSETMHAVIKWAYTGQVDDMVNKAEPLLAASEKYNLKLLKVHCENMLTETLTVENASHVLILADLYDAENLRKFVLQYIKRNFQEVKKTAGFMNDILTCPRLMASIMEINNYDEYLKKVVKEEPVSSDEQ